MKAFLSCLIAIVITNTLPAQAPAKDTVSTLQEVKVTGRKPLLKMTEGRIVLQPDAMVTNAGTTVLEMLGKMPGVTIDKDNNISLKGRPGILVMIDDKPTYLDPAALRSLLEGMSSLQVEQVELITNPSSRYDAAGNAGIINIKTKQKKEKGFNGTLTLAAGQGRYIKNNNSVSLNHRNNRFNAFLTYSVNHNKGYTDIYALRKYYDASGRLLSVLDQPTYLTATSTNHTLRTGIDYTVSPKTTAGVVLTGISARRSGNGDATATWQNPYGAIDSAIRTLSNSSNGFRNGGTGIYIKHTISKKQNLSADLDVLGYDIRNQQFFTNQLQQPGGYTEASRGDIPARISIFSAKADHVIKTGESLQIASGCKTSQIHTDNTAEYESYDGIRWKEDLGKSNHFIYGEQIYALYSNATLSQGPVVVNAGLRYELTRYNAVQQGNAVNKDSSFSRNYASLFPSAAITWQADSSHSFTLAAGRRIDRPAFQALNPFVFIINKYTYQQGNPFFRPQYTWNMELSHQYKQALTTSVSYSIIRDYFSQLFLTRDDGILIYAEGNVGRMHNLAVSATLQISPAGWWTITGEATGNYKRFNGYVGTSINSSVTQLNTNISNQFLLTKGISAELSGFYTTRARNDLQELLSPTGQVSVGFSVPVLQKKGTVKTSWRDIFYTQVMEGVTDFRSASEYFILRRDTRVVNISFIYHFGKSFKAARRSEGGAADEMQRAAGQG